MLTDERKEHCRFNDEVLMDDKHLSLLAQASQPTQCARCLIDSPILRVLGQAIAEFCHKQLQSRGNQETPAQQNQSRQGAGALGGSVMTGGSSVLLTWQTLPVILTFFRQCASSHTKLKDWMGSTEGYVFWAPLLELFSTNAHAYSMRSDFDQSIESSVVAFFKTVTLNHTVNQFAFSAVLCNLLRVIASMPNSVAGSSLSSFMKNLILQTLLEDEKVYITVTSHGLNYSFSNNNSTVSPRHLGVGVGHSTRTVHISIYDSMEKLAKLISRPDKSSKSSLSRQTKAASLQQQQNKQQQTAEYMEQMAELGLIGAGATGAMSEYGDYVDPFIDDLIYSALSSGENAKSKRDNKKSKTSSTQTDQSKIRGSTRKIQFLHPLIKDRVLSERTTIADLIGSMLEKGMQMGCEHITLQICSDKEPSTNTLSLDNPVNSTLTVFTSQGGLALLAEHLPLLYPEITQQQLSSKLSSGVSSGGSAGNTESSNTAAELSDQDYEFVTQVKGISLGNIQYETVSGGAGGKKDNTKKTATGPTSIPPHSLIAFGLFLRLPGYAEMLIKQRTKAKCLLRLVLGARDDGEGLAVLASPVASSLPTLPFTNLKLLYQSSPLTTDDGITLRRTSMQIGALHLVLACLSALSHHKPRRVTKSAEHEELTNAATLMANQVMGSVSQSNGGSSKKSGPTPAATRREEQTGQQYWAKGTGFGTGSTTTQWDLEQSLLKQQGEEEHVTCMLDIISSMIDPDDRQQVQSDTDTSHVDVLPDALCDRLSESCLLPAIASYLRNDSVLDISRHVPLYQSVYRMLRALSSSTHLVSLLVEPVKESDTSTLQTLTANMERCVATYKSRLRPASSKPATGSNTGPSAGSGPGSSSFPRRNTGAVGTPGTAAAAGTAGDKASTEEEDQANSLNELATVLTNTHNMLTAAVQRHRTEAATSPKRNQNQQRKRDAKPRLSYEEILKHLQFDTYRFVDMSTSAVKLIHHHHYEMSIRQANIASGNNARTRRLAQEAVTLSTSLPLSASSSVFVRCDEERMDVMKVLITGPADTPYMNGCFEFDVFFPADYPTSPPLINLQTTGNHKVRFNPNLYNDGKICLSVLNTWHGRPEEKWNAQTSSFLQVLVSIQSLILVSEPYFNEPGYERSRGTPAGTANCREYDSNIRQATVKYAMLEMIKNPPACFREIIQKHFWMKRNEIKDQIELWLADQSIPESDLPPSKSAAANKSKTEHTIAHNTMLLRKHYQQLLAEFQRMKRPEGIEEDTEPPSAMEITTTTSTPVDKPTSSAPGTSTGNVQPEAVEASSSGLVNDYPYADSMPPGVDGIPDGMPDGLPPGLAILSNHLSEMAEEEIMMDAHDGLSSHSSDGMDIDHSPLYDPAEGELDSAPYPPEDDPGMFL